MITDQLTVKGWVVIQLFDRDGNLKETSLSNTVTTSGKNGLADQILAAPTLAKPTHMAVGSGTPAANALGVEISPRVAFTSKTRANAVVTVVGTFPAGTGTGALTEAGWFDQLAAGGQMWCSTSFSVINKGASDSLVINWTLTIS